MILPTKRISSDRALLTVGARVIELLDQPKTVSRLWSEYRTEHNDEISYDWFVLALDLLYMMGAIERSNGLISLRQQ